MGVKIPLDYSVHLYFPRIPRYEIDKDFPRVLRCVGFGTQRFRIPEAMQNAEALIEQAERRYRTIGKKALNELLSLWPSFIYHPRVQHLFKTILSKGQHHFAPPPGRPKGRGGYLSDFDVFSAVGYLRRPPFQMSVRRAWTELAEKWKTHYSSVRDAYRRACQRFKPLAIVNRSLPAPPGVEPLEMGFTGTWNQKTNKTTMRFRPRAWIQREPLANGLLLIHRFRQTASGTLYVRSDYEADGRPCVIAVEPGLMGRGVINQGKSELPDQAGGKASPVRGNIRGDARESKNP